MHFALLPLTANEQCLQVAPEYRRQGLANKLMNLLEEITIKRCAARSGCT